ncbi:HIT family protein [Candidatus Pacearchaeota archaeon]|nr:HIT family protein [Candidatus Pacearchaeota archaeon]
MEKEEVESLRQSILEQIEQQSFPEETKTKLREQIENASDEEIEKFIKQQTSAAGSGGGGAVGEGQCIFCSIVEGKIDTVKVYENSDIMAFLDINPASRGHCLIIPKKHFQFLFQIPDNIVSQLFLTAKKIMPSLINVTNAEGIAVYIAQGIEQTLPHLVINLIPRVKDDKLRFAWERKKVELDELNMIANELKLRLGKEEETEKKQKEQEVKQKAQEEDDIDKIFRQIKRRP